MYNFKINDNRVRYEFSINEKFTIVKGDSATGKSTLDKLVSLIKSRTVQFQGDLKTLPIPVDGYEPMLHDYNNTLIIIDETHTLFDDKVDMARRLKTSNNYFLIITRENLSQLPVSIESMRKIKTSGNYHYLVPLYDEKPIDENNNQEKHYIDGIITEDMKSGNKFMSRYFNCDCIPASGVTNIKFIMANILGSKNILVFYDSLSAGYEQENIRRMSERKNKVGWILFHPKSFEKYILDSPMLSWKADDNELVSDLENYYEAELKRILPMGYNKGNCSLCLLQECDCGTKCNGCLIKVVSGLKRKMLMHSGLELVAAKEDLE